MRLLLLLSIVAIVLLLPMPAWGQSRTMEFLRRMDENGNGRIDPGEISDRARPYIERYANIAGLRMSESMRLSRLEDAVKEYYRRRESEGSQNSQSSSGDRSGSSSSAGAVRVPGFGPAFGAPPVPGFGLETEAKYRYTRDDERRADSRLQRDDRNRDGVIDRAEARMADWSERDPFIYDFNNDGRLSRHEIAQRYAKRRIDDDQRREARRQEQQREQSRDDRSREASRDDSRSRSSNDSRDSRYSQQRSNVDRGAYYLAVTLLSRYDANRNGRLDRSEWSNVGENIVQADQDQDGQIARDELTQWVTLESQKRTREVPPELPEWFIEHDTNEDGQISMAEFAKQWTDELAEEFIGYDHDGDGIITSDEAIQVETSLVGSYVDKLAKVILPRTTLVADIEVEDDYLIGDLDVQLSITHTSADQLDVYLIGPEGQRIELFTAVGGNDDHFDRTILDDEASTRISSARPPFAGRFQPESAGSRSPSLRHFYGKSVHGLWQLMIRSTRSDRSGVLHGWSLIVKRPVSAE